MTYSLVFVYVIQSGSHDSSLYGPLELSMAETIEQETELGRTQPSQIVTGVSRPSLPSAKITVPVQELGYIDREEDCCMQHVIIPWMKERVSMWSSMSLT